MEIEEQKLNQNNNNICVNYSVAIFALLLIIVISICWLIFSKQLFKSNKPVLVNNSNSIVTAEIVHSWKTLSDPIFNFTFKYPEEWETNITQIVQLGSKNNRSWPTARFWTRSKKYVAAYDSSISDATIDIYIGKTNKTLFQNIFKDLSPSYASYIGDKEQNLTIDNQIALQTTYTIGEEPPNPSTTTIVYYPDDVYLQITFSSTDKDKQQKYFPIYKEVLASLHRDLTSEKIANPFSIFVSNITKNGVLPKQWGGATISVNILANDLYQVVVEYNNILEENETFLSYSEYWTNNRTGNWELLGRYSSGQQGLSTCEDWEKLKVAKGMTCSRLDDGKASQVRY